jgi:hypothetical protein
MVRQAHHDILKEPVEGWPRLALVFLSPSQALAWDGIDLNSAYRYLSASISAMI